MKIAVASLKSVSPYGQSAAFQSEKPRDMTHNEFEKQNWRERMHVTKDGYVFIPPMAFKNCIAEAAKYKSIQIPGKGKATYTKHFEAGILVLDPVVLPIKAKDVEPLKLFVPASGRRGDGSRVWKWFPVIDQWEADVTFNIFDETIDKEVFEAHLVDAGQFIGIGFFRPRKNGYFGRFSVEGIKWS